MIRRTKTSDTANERAALGDSLRSGVTATENAAVEAHVLEHFLRYPSDSRDMVSIAAVACRVRDVLAAELSEDVAAPIGKIVSHSH